MCAEQYVVGLSGWVGCQQWLLREHIGGDSDSTTPGKVDQGIEVDYSGAADQHQRGARWHLGKALSSKKSLVVRGHSSDDKTT